MNSHIRRKIGNVKTGTFKLIYRFQKVCTCTTRNYLCCCYLTVPCSFSSGDVLSVYFRLDALVRSTECVNYEDEVLTGPNKTAAYERILKYLDISKYALLLLIILMQLRP